MADGDRVVVYTTEPCGFCRQAKDLLDSRDIAYDEVNLARDAPSRERLIRLTGQMTFPQILIGERAIGGFRELIEADRDGTLRDLLAVAAG